MLFCDLVGFTATSDAADPEDVQADDPALPPTAEASDRGLRRHRGEVHRRRRDGGLRRARSPTRTTPSARSERGFGSSTRSRRPNADDPALDLKVRIGINTGEAVVSLGARPEQGEGFVTGDVVNTASRLQGVAPVNGIAVGEATHEATASIFEFEELEPVELKGKAEPVRLWWAKAARSRFGTDVTRTHTTPLVGRELERDLLHRDVRTRRPRPIRAPRHRGRRARHRQVTARRGALRLLRPFVPISSPGGKGGACPTARASRSGPWARS